MANIWDKVKSAASQVTNTITGKSAVITLEAVQAKLHEAFTVKISATLSDSDLSVEKVYLFVEGTETTPPIGAEPKQIHAEYLVAPAGVLKEKQMYNWEKQIQLPIPSNINAQYDWKILVGLDTVGTDPDSGWISITVD